MQFWTQASSLLQTVHPSPPRPSPRSTGARGAESSIWQHPILRTWRNNKRTVCNSRFISPRRPCIERLETRDLLTSITLNPIADNTLYESSSGNLSNGTGIHLFAGKTDQAVNSLRRGVLKFDVASAIPAGAHIDSATLQLNMSKSISGAADIALHEILADWGEGTTDAAAEEGRGATATTNSATWKHRFFSTVNWASDGGDFNPTASAITAVSSVGSYQWSSAAMAADVQSWLDNPNTQFGWVLKAVSESVAGSAKRFDTRESSSPPQLTIDYSLSNPPPTLDGIADPQPILEDAAQQTIILSGISDGGDGTQTLTVTASSSDTTVVPNPTVTYTSPNSTGQLTYKSAANQFGNVVITVTVRNSGASITRQFNVAVKSVNDAPSFSMVGTDITVDDDDGPQESANWVTASSPGPSNESQQAIDYLVTTSDSALFAAGPTIDASGRLTFTPRGNQSGTATVTVRAHDNGGLADNGVDTSPPQSFDITVNKPFPWHNSIKALDVDGDNEVFPIDAVLVINYLNAHLPTDVPPNAPIGPNFFDTSPDNLIVPLDAILIINFLNSVQGADGESRRAGGVSPLFLSAETSTLHNSTLSGAPLLDLSQRTPSDGPLLVADVVDLRNMVAGRRSRICVQL